MKKIIYTFIFFSVLIFACNTKTETENKDCCKNPGSGTIASVAKSTESIYQLEGEWKDQNGETVILNSLKGKIRVTAMIFTNCAFACPRIIADIQDIEKKLTPEQKNNVEFLLISFDVKRDTSERLKAFAREMQLGKNWKLLHGQENLVRELSLLLDIKYELQNDGSFAHSNAITVLDQNGSIAYRQEGLGSDNKKTLFTISELLQKN